MAHLIGSWENLQPNATVYIGRYPKCVSRRWAVARCNSMNTLRPDAIVAGIFTTEIGAATGIRGLQGGGRDFHEESGS